MIRDFGFKGLEYLAHKIGITRLADITGLDIAGLPVVQAVRPLSLSNAVSQGKGKTIEAAMLSAIFESAESYAAERLTGFDVTLASAEELDIPADRFENYLLSDVSPNWHKKTLPWVTGHHVLNGRASMLPLELVHTAYVLPHSPHDGYFCASTTGLAAAFEADDARLHGILECIERDAIAQALKTRGFLQHRRIDLKTIKDSGLCNLLENLNQRGFLVSLWHASSPVGVPVIWCHLMESCEINSALMPFPAEGSAARQDVAVAASHAIYEAAQSRVTAISGARDDFTRRNYPKYPDWELLAAHQRLIVEGPREIHFEEVQPEISHGINGLLPKLETCGHGDVFEVTLDRGDMPSEILVRKIIIPSLLPLLEGFE